MIGRRLFHKPVAYCEAEPGAYWKTADGWLAITPNGHLCNLAKHAVVELEDGTITVSPSILVQAPRNGKSVELWHGYLERGVWTACA